MSEPVWIDCGSVPEVMSPQQLAAQTSGGHHVVLRFQALTKDEKAELITRLSEALTEFSIFDSGGGLSPAWITVKPVVAKARVLEVRDEVLRAIEEYRTSSHELVEQYKSGSLSREWTTYEHGGHCCFANRGTGQIVEAPLTDIPWIEADKIDPYFFAKFAKTTMGIGSIAELIDDDYHDARRILDIVDAGV